jgi:hypothetical protein
MHCGEDLQRVKIENVEERLRKIYPEKDAQRFANAFRIIPAIRSNYCNTETSVNDINKKFDFLKIHLTEKMFLDNVESIQREINAELSKGGRLDEKHVEEVRDFCEMCTEMMGFIPKVWNVIYAP